MPAYFFDRYRYRTHKMKGGSFQKYTDKTYLPLTDEQILKHLSGEQLIGIYPLLKDNTSWFIAADFDGDKWHEQCKTTIKYLNDKNIPAYLERSRSGNGGHIWTFFEQPYPAIKSRKILIHHLQESGVLSVFDKSSSFDRLFPNQDFLSGKGLGNLIALPLHKQSLEQGNSCFIDAETLQPFPDQWEFLKGIHRISVPELDRLYNEISQSAEIKTNVPFTEGKFSITLNKNVHISRIGMSGHLIDFLKEELNFLNSEFIIKKKIGKNTWGTERYFRFVEETENDVIIPRGFIGRLLRFCKEQKIEYDFQDERKKLEPKLFSSTVELREHQKSAIEAVSKKDMGVIVAPPGSGKTIIGLKIIAEKQQPALIIVHRKQLAEQWIERIQTFLGIPKHEIGKIGQGKNTAGKKITVAMIQSLAKELANEKNELQNSFGTIIVDECHHIPAESFRNTISKLNTFYLYGLTATPFRKYNDGKLIFIHLGEIISELKPQEIGAHSQAKSIIRNTELDVPFNSRTDSFETLSKILVHDSTRNKLILEDVTSELKSGKKAVVITERKEHIDSLYQFLKQSYETITFSGDDSETNRQQKWKILKEGNYQVLITTGQLFGEGTDLQNAQCLFLVYPFSFKGKLIQYIGRVQRSEATPTIYDYRDYRIDYLNKMFLKRNTYYRKIEKIPSLFDEPEDETTDSLNIFTLEKKVKIPIDELEFRYGAIAFRYKIPEINTELDFEIENLEIRPEFDVLKPYFSKLLKTKKATIDIHAEFENSKLVSQLASSDDLEKINREIIDSVKFRFVFNIIGNVPINGKSIIDLKELQSDGKGETALYNSEEELLEDILKNKKAKHYQQLRYLAQKHDGSILKIRFVLNPFSFVFLLSGAEQFHIILETLDTEEATYLWHFEKDKRQLPNYLKQMEQHLSIIRNKGREEFLKSQPQNFSRIIHDYSDERKGFVLWKDLLEERLALPSVPTQLRYGALSSF